MMKISVENRRIFLKISNATDGRPKSVKGEYIGRGPGVLAVVLFGSIPHPSPVSCTGDTEGRKKGREHRLQDIGTVISKGEKGIFDPNKTTA